MRRRNFLAATSAIALTPRLAFAKERFPSRPITLLVPFDAGGGLDLHARAVAPVLERLLGQPVVILNRPGAGGASGLTWVLQQTRPDGHTIVASTLRGRRPAPASAKEGLNKSAIADLFTGIGGLLRGLWLP